MSMQIGDGMSMKIQVFISARNLKDKDFFSKSDPYVKVFFRRDFNVKQYLPIGKTQTINNNLNPTFQKSFVIDYIFQSRQDIKFQVMDDDSGNDDHLGTVQTTVGALMGAKNQTSILDIKQQSKFAGKLIVRCEKVNESNDWYVMKWKAQKLMNTDSYFDFWDKSDPFLKFMKIRQDNTLLQAARTETIKDNLNPSWKLLQVNSGRLHTKNNCKFKLECWDWEQSGKHQFIGQCFPDIATLRNSNLPLQFPLVNPKAKKPGYLILEQFKTYTKPSFIDYLRGGLQLNMVIAIDFTGSNGTPKHPTSLHYMDPYKPNQYQSAIQAVGNILLNYDSDKRIPSFGFGAKPHFPQLNSITVSHCFPLSGDPNNIEAFGINHLMAIYNNALPNLEFGGPTYFGPIIQEAIKVASMSRDEGSRSYQVLLILTDGQIHDMDQTIDLLVESSGLPISIIIVGVGNADFGNMMRLDGDSGLFNSKGKKAPRDIVQFVPFRDVKMSNDLLAKQLLAELPQQVVQYMTLIGIPPGKAGYANIDDMLGPQQINQKQTQQLANMLDKVNFFGQPNPQIPNKQEYNGKQNVNPYGDL